MKCKGAQPKYTESINIKTNQEKRYKIKKIKNTRNMKTAIGSHSMAKGLEENGL
jgi:hypothetical protein